MTSLSDEVNAGDELTVERIPVEAPPVDAKSMLQQLGANLAELVKESTKEALDELKESSSEAGRRAVKIAKKMAEIAVDVAEGDIDQESAEEILSHYMQALVNLEQAVENEAKRKSFKRGKMLLVSAQKMVIGTASAALNFALPGVGGLLGGALEQLPLDEWLGLEA
jgi:ABC-type transporter Mla subunit MlaD